MASQTRAVGERAAKLVGIELPKKAEAAKAAARRPPQEGSRQEGSGQEGPGQEGRPAKKVTQK